MPSEAPGTSGERGQALPIQRGQGMARGRRVGAVRPDPDEPETVDADSIAAMEKRGLKVQKLTPAAAAEFRAAADTLTATMRGGMVPADVFDAAMAARTAFRKTKKPS